MPERVNLRTMVSLAMAWCCLLGDGLAPARAGETGPIVAVLDIEDRGSGLSADVLDRLTDYLAVLMAEAGYSVVPREQIRDRLVQMQKESYKSCYDQKCQIDLGRELAAQKVLAPKVLQIGGECRLLGTLLDLKLAASERAATAKAACNERGMLLAVERLVAKLTGQRTSRSRHPPTTPPRPAPVSRPAKTAKPAPVKSPGRRKATLPAGKKPGRKTARKKTSLLMVAVGVAYPHLGDALSLDSGDAHGEIDSGTGVLATMRMDFGSGGSDSFQVYIGGVVHFLYAQDSGDDDSLKYYVLGMATTGNIPLTGWLDFRFVLDVGLGMHLGTKITMAGADSNQLSITKLTGVYLGGVLELIWKMGSGLNLVLAAGAMGEVYGSYSDSNGEHDFKFPPHLFTSLGIETAF